jgi:hypothetical protein
MLLFFVMGSGGNKIAQGNKFLVQEIRKLGNRFFFFKISFGLFLLFYRFVFFVHSSPSGASLSYEQSHKLSL